MFPPMLTSTVRLLVQGITGKEGLFHTQRMLEAGTPIVGGISPGRGGEWVKGIPVFDSVDTAVKATEADTSVIFVPADHAPDAIYEAIDGGILRIVCITEGIPLLDTIRLREYIRLTPARLFGPNSPGFLVPNSYNVGIIPHEIARPGHVAVISRSGTLTYEVVQHLSQNGFGQSCIVGIGGDAVLGTTFVDALKYLENDPTTQQIVLLGEIGGELELDAANFINNRMTKPVIAYITGQEAPIRVRMGHAGAVIDSPETTAASKIEALQRAGCKIAQDPFSIVNHLSNITRADEPTL